MSKENDIVQFRGKAMFARIKEPRIQTNENYKDRWEIELLIDKSEKAKAEKLGVRRFDDSNRTSKPHEDFVKEQGLDALGYDGTYLSAYKNTTNGVWETNKAGKKVEVDSVEAKPVIVRDAAGNEIPFDLIPNIGNGSDVMLNVSVLSNSSKKEGEWGLRLISLTIYDLVEYNPEPKEKGGYVFDPSTSVDPSDEVKKPVKKSAKTADQEISEGADPLADEIPF